MKIFGQLPSKGWQRYVYAFLFTTKRLSIIPSMMVLFLSFYTSNLHAQIVINELLPNGTVELKNIGSSTVNVANYWLCDFPAYEQISSRNIICGNTMMAPGEILAIDDFNFVDADDGEMGLYLNGSFSNPNSIIDYVEWGTSGHARASVAIAAGIWSANSFVPAFMNGQSIAYSGAGDLPSSWSAGAPTICAENDATGACEVEGGSIALDNGTTETSICVDGNADPLNVTVSGANGQNGGWIITDSNNNILGLPQAPPFDLDGAGVGTCIIWYIRYEEGLTGKMMGNNLADLDGCFDLSNGVTVIREAPDGGMVSLADGSTEFTGTAGDIVFEVTHTTASPNLSYWYIITDNNDNILTWLNSADGNTINADQAPAGECHVWGWNYRGLPDPIVGENIATLTDDDCEDISDNFITVTRLETACEVEGGTLAGGPFEFCVGDGMADNVSGITLDGNTGPNSTWVVTFEDGTIGGLPPMPGVVDFDTSGEGVCSIWNISYEDGLTGLVMGQNINDLVGCYSLSNPVIVVRNQPEGGTLTGGPFEFCVGDGIADNVSGITLNGNTGANSAWVVTFEDGTIGGLPPMPGAVDFDTSGEGVCSIWNISYEDGLTGLVMGQNINDLVGCYSLSNSVIVVRNQPEGGTLTGGPFEFCVGDGMADNVSGITLDGNSGPNSAWVVTFEDGTIGGLPPMPGVVDFDTSGEGVCSIWNISYEDGLTGLVMGQNINDLVGCYSLSNPVIVVRNQPEGGTLTGGPFEFCVGDGIADNVSGITLDGNTGANSAWVVTFEDGTIGGLPPMPGVVDFDTSGEGVCSIWNISYEDGLTGLEMGQNINDIEGCYSLSNAVIVVRNEDPNCGNMCDVEGGTLTGGPFEFCVGDGIPDNVSGITLDGNTGANSAWVVTFEDGTIGGLPPMPGVVDFDTSGEGVCSIWNISYEDGLTGLVMGQNINDIEGCYSLSNPVIVVRNQPEGGTLTGGPFEFCVGDGITDNVSGITLDGNTGANSAWVVTFEDGTIGGLPPMPGVVDFDTSGEGVCSIWNISYEDGLTGLVMGQNINDLVGCYSLSNPVIVVRNQPEGGTLTGGPFEFCVGDGIADNVSGITLDGNTGANSAWVVTFEDGTIGGLPPMPGVVDFDTSGEGVCSIWNISYEDGLTGLIMGQNINDLEGCYSLSNPVIVVRNQPEAGEITLDNGNTETSICVDGNADPLNIEFTANPSGPVNGWVITDTENNILGLPQAPPFDLDGAGVGTCLIWHISHEDGLTGVMVGNNVSDLEGCYDLSNPITVYREAPDGGEVSLPDGSFDYTGCAGDIVFDVSHTTASPNLSYWYIITDDNDNILAWLNSADGSTLDLSVAPAGECHVWGWNYRGLDDPIVGEHISTLDDDDCESISGNWITITRLPSSDPACGGPAPTNQYVLVGIHEVDVEKNVFHSGGVGVIEDSGKAEVSEESYITVDGTFINAPEIEINSGAKVNNACAIAATPELPECLLNDSDAGSELSIKVHSNEVVTLDQAIYEKVDVRNSATIIFSGNSHVYIEDFKSRADVTILFDQCTNLIIKDDFVLGESNNFNPDEENVFVFAEDDATINKGTQVYGVVYAKDKFKVEKSSEDNPTELHGLFIGNQVRSRDNAMYYQQNFSACDPTTNSNTETIQANLLQADLLEQTNTNEGNQLKAIVYPNPAKNVAFLNFTKEVEATATLQIYNSVNQQVLTTQVITLSTQPLELDISTLPTGIYHVVITPKDGKVMNQKLVVATTE